jgi:glycosyltransferase involved in cell wall biosynthesis
MRHGVVFNGKFLSAQPTGVHRVADELIRHMDAALAARPHLASERRWDLVKPPDARRSMTLSAVRERTAGILTWQAWEQFELPWLARGATLVNLCNLAPVFKHDSVTMIHDAQVFITPDSYGKAFAAWYRFALPAIGRSSRMILTVSDYSRRMLAEYGVAPMEKIAVVHNGVDHLNAVVADPGLVDRHALTPGRFVVALANTQKHKNIRLLLETFARPRMRTIPLVLIGRAGRDEFDQAGLKVPANVVFAGAVSDGQMRGLIEAAGCLAFPSTTEGFGLPPLEAMSLGCPVVAAPCGALPEVCGDAALYGEADDPVAWESHILTLLEASGERATRIGLGRRQAARFSWSRSADRLLELVRGAADGRPAQMGGIE